MPFFDNSRAHRQVSRMTAALVDCIRPEDAKGPSTRQVDGDVWYASMFLYPNHWEAGRPGALPLPDSPYRNFPVRAMLAQSRDYVFSFVILCLLYCVVWHPFWSTSEVDVSGSF